MSGVMAHKCNPSIWEIEAGGFQTQSLGYAMILPLHLSKGEKHDT